VIVCIGDSITAGQYLEGPAWPALLAVGDVVAAAVSGDTTRTALERFPRDVQAREPEVVVIQFGHNDANRWQTDGGVPRVSERAYAANLHEMLDRCRAFGAVPYLCSITPVLRDGAYSEDVRAYDGILRDVAAERAVPVIDVYEAFLARDLEELLLADGLHLSAEGHRVYADTVMRVLA
jgi:lysophospholipase L1-like esterase